MTKKILKLTVLTMISSTILFIGCKTMTEILERDGFADEEYVWENWSVSTNTISIIDVKGK